MSSTTRGLKKQLAQCDKEHRGLVLAAEQLLDANRLLESKLTNMSRLVDARRDIVNKLVETKQQQLSQAADERARLQQEVQALIKERDAVFQEVAVAHRSALDQRKSLRLDEIDSNQHTEGEIIDQRKRIDLLKEEIAYLKNVEKQQTSEENELRRLLDEDLVRALGKELTSIEANIRQLDVAHREAQPNIREVHRKIADLEMKNRAMRAVLAKNHVDIKHY
ncbi:Lebercilin domain-containing protein [Plasmodiophora brassicae]|uniref:Uncharacterized protein n=1 Tax=Plasmodiophora brassicae TaxID=37360 RepID=A0A0G4IL08_PLABS|nr:hypothetical protein PBRA_004626 [Plasmodiophora brassicae]SPQ93515.1 unnamed protein product [Plasmodiophora brassicae]